jgi:uncharacterized protein involved in exopolysaccharide biosynthesis
LATNLQHTTAPPRIEVLSALRRHWIVALLPVVLFVTAAVELGLRRPVRYTTTANLSVGHVYVNNAAGIPTIIEATQSLAAVYSRAIRSGAVVADTRRRLGHDSSSASGSVTATPIPDSPLIKVSAESSSQRGAVELANAASAALAAYVNGQVRDNEASTTLSARYRQAALRYREVVDARDRAAHRFRRHPTRKNKARRDRTAAEADTALLRRDALRASYQQAVQGGTSSVGAEMFSRASTPTSDRWRVMQLLAFVGLIGGLAAGTALALLRSYRKPRPLG